jgi:hypothetical protein
MSNIEYILCYYCTTQIVSQFDTGIVLYYWLHIKSWYLDKSSTENKHISFENLVSYLGKACFNLKWMIFYANQLMSLSYIKEILDKDIPKCKTFNNLKSLKTKEWDVLWLWFGGLFSEAFSLPTDSHSEPQWCNSFSLFIIS